MRERIALWMCFIAIAASLVWYARFIASCGRFPLGSGEMGNWILGLTSC